MRKLRKFLPILLSVLMIISSLCIFACGSNQPKNVSYHNDVALIDVNGIDVFDVKTALTGKAKSSVSGKKDLTWKLTSVATTTEFVFDDSSINLSEIHREYYLLDVIKEDEVIATAKLDFYDIENDGIVWCEMNEYTVGAVRTDAPSKITFEYQSEEFYEGTVITAQPETPKYWRFAYYAIMPFHSKEYYLEFTNMATMFEIGYVRKAVYNDQSWNYNPDTMTHLNGTYAPYGSVINVRYFGCGGNVSSTGATLNAPQSLVFRMQDILEWFDAIGNHEGGFGSRWYFVGTCHDKGNPYKVTYFFNYIDIVQY